MPTMMLKPSHAVLGAALLLSACVTVPEGPSVMVLPGSGKTFNQFQLDDYTCRQYAKQSIGGSSAQQAATEAGVKSAAVGAAVGAAAGALMGGHEGAGSGAGAGLAVGALAGTGAAQGSAYDLQRRYNAAYIQCMYAKGNRVPVAGEMQQAPAPAPGSYAPPPPPPPPPSR
jgi:outer membrane lipoprotein SlyB